jgi:predicted helicase
MFRNDKLPDEIIRRTFALNDTSSWKLTEQRKKVMQDEGWEDKFEKILYRPFDARWIFYQFDIVDRGRTDVMQNMMQGDNVALATTRSIEIPRGFEHVLCTTNMIQGHTVSIKEGNYLFPLYLYPPAMERNHQHDFTEVATKSANLAPELLEGLGRAYGRRLAPEAVFHYIYAVLYSTEYRRKYAEFLKSDFPRVLFTSSHKVFEQMSRLGNRLVDLHLMKSKGLDQPIARFQGDGNNRVEKPRYSEEEGRVYINKAQYFEGVEREVWEYTIGGYQVPEKWLKDRKDRTLNLDDIKHYCRIITALKKTIELQQQIDDLYPAVEESVIAFS